MVAVLLLFVASVVAVAAVAPLVLVLLSALVGFVAADSTPGDYIFSRRGHPSTSYSSDDTVDPGFEQHVNSLRSTMFYVCQGSCLCGTVNNRGKVIYCYGDLVPRQGELFEEGGDSGGGATTRDLLAVQIAVWVVGLLLLLIVLLLIRKSIVSMRRHVERMADRLPVYHDDEDVLSTNSATTSPVRHSSTKETNVDGVRSPVLSHDHGHHVHGANGGHHISLHDVRDGHHGGAVGGEEELMQQQTEVEK